MNEQLYQIDYGSNDWDQLGVIDQNGESIGVLVPVEPDYAEFNRALRNRASLIRKHGVEGAFGQNWMMDKLLAAAYGIGGSE